MKTGYIKINVFIVVELLTYDDFVVDPTDLTFLFMFLVFLYFYETCYDNMTTIKLENRTSTY